MQRGPDLPKVERTQKVQLPNNEVLGSYCAYSGFFVLHTWYLVAKGNVFKTMRLIPIRFQEPFLVEDFEKICRGGDRKLWPPAEIAMQSGVHILLELLGGSVGLGSPLGTPIPTLQPPGFTSQRVHEAM